VALWRAGQGVAYSRGALLLLRRGRPLVTDGLTRLAPFLVRGVTTTGVDRGEHSGLIRARCYPRVCPFVVPLAPDKDSSIRSQDGHGQVALGGRRANAGSPQLHMVMALL